MKLAYSFAHLDEPTREKYADIKSRYRFDFYLELVESIC